MKEEKLSVEALYGFFKKESTILLMIVILGGFLRLFNLMYYPEYHHDEGVYHEYSENMVLHGELRLFNVNMLSQPPLYLFLGGVFSFVFDLDFFGMRLLSALFGIFSIPLVYLIGRKLYGGKVGLLGALIISTSPLTILVNRMYLLDSGTEFFFLLTFLFLLRYCDKSNIINACMLGLCCGLALLSKLMGVSALIFIYFVFFYYKKKFSHLVLINIIAFALLSIYPILMLLKNPSFLGVTVHMEQSKGYAEPLTLLFHPRGNPPEIGAIKSLYLVPGIISFILWSYKPKKENYLVIFAFVSVVISFILHGHIVARYFPVLLAVISIILAKFLIDTYESRDRLIVLALLFTVPVSFFAISISARIYIYLYQAIIAGFILCCLIFTRYLYTERRNKNIFLLLLSAIILSSVVGMAYPELAQNSNLDADRTIDYINDHTNKTDYILSNPLIAALVDCNALSYYYKNPESEVNITIFKYFIHDVNDPIDYLTRYDRMESIQNWTVEEHFDDFVIYRNPDR